MLQKLCLLVLIAGISTVCRSSQNEEATVTSPNFVIILADDLGFSDLGCFGSEIRTPHLDSLAAGGVRFTQFYNAARCCPSRASLLTGLYPHQAGMGGMVSTGDRRRPAGPYQGYLRRDSTLTIAEALRPLGYRNYMSGKWHVSEYRENWPLQRGFDRYFGLISGASSYYELLDEGDRVRIMLRENEPFVPAGEDFYLTDAIADYAVECLQEHHADFSGRPFFLYLAFTAPHWPLHAPEEVVAKYDGYYRIGWDSLRQERYRRQQELGLFGDTPPVLSERTPGIPDWPPPPDSVDWQRRMAVYAAMVDRMDQGIGRVLSALKALGAAENTLVLFLSDNGACAENIEGRRLHQEGRQTGERGSYRAYREPWANAGNTPFRYYKSWVHEGGITSPSILHFPPAGLAGGSVVNAPAHVIDILPTFLKLAGQSTSLPGNLPLPGIDLLSLISEEAPSVARTLFWEHQGNRAIRQGDLKLVAAGESDWELYDLRNDRTETYNLADRYPEQVDALREKFEQWAKQLGVER